MGNKNLIIGLVISILSFFLSTSQAQKVLPSIDAFTTDYKYVADIYEQNLIPHLYKFAEMQYRPLSEGASEMDSILRKRQIEGAVHIHKTNFKHHLKVSLEYLQQEGLPNYAINGRMAIVEHLEFGLKTQFLFLDYHYYEKTALDVSKLD